MKTLNQYLGASSRMALAAYLHDLGKFSQRAKMDVDSETLEKHKHIYCPFRKEGGWHSHVHAAYTALSIDRLEPDMPAIIGQDMSPFASFDALDVDDSLINAAAMHHRPVTALQWIVATADRVASGFERESFDQYNAQNEKKDFYQTRLLTLFEQINISDNGEVTQQQVTYRYPLKPLSVAASFPQLASDCETASKKQAQQEYQLLWDDFLQKIKQIPHSHQRLDLWLEHFDSLWQTYTHAIPAATAFGTKPEVSLYDHSRATAALATAIWRYYEEHQVPDQQIIQGLKERQDWDQQQLLLIQGDLFGIQQFIFSEGSQTNKQAAKLLRGRSFYVSLLSEIAALKVLEGLGLPGTSQIINAAGKFMIVAPNTDAVKAQLKQIKDDINQWFLQHTYAETGLGLAWQPACCNDFINNKDKTSHFNQLVHQLFAELETARLQRYQLCATDTQPVTVFTDYLQQFKWGNCAYNHYLPASEINHKNIALNKLSQDQIQLGENLSHYSRYIISNQPLEQGDRKNALQLDIFGYHVLFTGNENISGKFGPAVKAGTIRRMYDFSLPQRVDQILFNGYARRNINTFVASFSTDDLRQQDYKYDVISDDEKIKLQSDILKPFSYIACEDRQPLEKTPDQWGGIQALMTLKGDVDNLGKIFEQGLKQSSFAKMASLSRQLNNFFALVLPWICRKDFPQTYTVFAGGDDFFLIGPWLQQQKLLLKMQEQFQRYVANNPDIHFSAGLVLTRSNTPVPTLAEQAEQALEQAKSFQSESQSKNAVHVYDTTLSWERYRALLQQKAALQRLQQAYELSGSYIYGLLQLTQMAAQAQQNPQQAIWYSWFNYRTARLCKDKLRFQGSKLEQAITEIADIIAIRGIKAFGGDYKVALYNYLYQLRK